MADRRTLKILGLMSGTSVDGLDIAYTKISSNPFELELIDFITIDYTEEERNWILSTMNSDNSLKQVCIDNKRLGVFFGMKVNYALEKMGIDPTEPDYISSHGQTLYHAPQEGASFQAGELADIAAITGIDTVGDFRPNDLAYGGQGAPLVPFVDQLLYGSGENKILLNMGGIANMTYISSDGQDILAFDSGPANVWLNDASLYYSQGRESYDKDAFWSKKGQINKQMIRELMKEDYYLDLQPPKSTGREYYTKKKLYSYLKKYDLKREDGLATLTEYTVMTIVDAIHKYILDRGKKVDRILLSGGGANNPLIVERLKDRLDMEVEIIPNSDAKEAIAFAILGYFFLNKEVNNSYQATGSQGPIVMGKLTYASGKH